MKIKISIHRIIRSSAVPGILALVFCLGLPAAWGEESKKDGKAARGRIAVINFRSNNTTDDIARIVRNTVEMQLFNRGSLDVLERNQIDLVISERKKQFSECREETCAAVIGRLLSADYVILGSVDRLDKFTVNIQVVDVKNKTVIIADSEDADELGMIKKSSERVTRRIAEKIEARLSGRVKGRAVFSVDFITAFPSGYMSRRLKTGYGVSARGGWENLFFRDFSVGVSYEYLNFSGRGDQVLSASVMPMLISLSYRMRAWKLVVIPGVSFGMSYNSVKTYNDVYRATNSRKNKVQPVISAEAMLEYHIKGPFFFHGGCRYHAIFEKGGNISFIMLHLGPGMRF